MQTNWSSGKNDYMWNPSTCERKCIKTSEIGDCLDKIYACKGRIIDNLVLTYEDEVLNITETALAVEKKKCFAKFSFHYFNDLINCVFTFVSSFFY